LELVVLDKIAPQRDLMELLQTYLIHLHHILLQVVEVEVEMMDHRIVEEMVDLEEEVVLLVEALLLEEQVLEIVVIQVELM
jgi:hypothetical protein